MYDCKDLLKLIKKASTEAVSASKPVHICFGKVISLNTLKIQVDQKLILSKQQLILSKNVTNYTTSIVLNGVTEAVTIKNGLNLNDKVLLLRMQGGQKYIVIDKVGG